MGRPGSRWPFVIVCSLVLRGFWARIAILLGLVFGYLLSWLLDATAGQITSVIGGSDGKAIDALPHRTSTGVGPADWFGLPHLHRAALLASTSRCWCCPR